MSKFGTLSLENVLRVKGDDDDEDSEIWQRDGDLRNPGKENPMIRNPKTSKRMACDFRAEAKFEPMVDTRSAAESLKPWGKLCQQEFPRSNSTNAGAAMPYPS
jgi:hypothetical protein